MGTGNSFQNTFTLKVFVSKRTILATALYTAEKQIIQNT